MAHCPGWSRDTSPATDNELRKCFDITLHLVLSLKLRLLTLMSGA